MGKLFVKALKVHQVNQQVPVESFIEVEYTVLHL